MNETQRPEYPNRILRGTVFRCRQMDYSIDDFNLTVPPYMMRDIPDEVFQICVNLHKPYRLKTLTVENSDKMKWDALALIF